MKQKHKPSGKNTGCLEGMCCPKCYYAADVAVFRGEVTDGDVIAYPPKEKTDGWILIDGDLGIPTLRDGENRPIIFTSKRAAELEIATDIQERLRQFINGEDRELKDIVWIDSVEECTVYPNGTIATEYNQWSLAELHEEWGVE